MKDNDDVLLYTLTVQDDEELDYDQQIDRLYELSRERPDDVPMPEDFLKP